MSLKTKYQNIIDYLEHNNIDYIYYTITKTYELRYLVDVNALKQPDYDNYINRYQDHDDTCEIDIIIYELIETDTSNCSNDHIYYLIRIDYSDDIYTFAKKFIIDDTKIDELINLLNNSLEMINDD